MEIKVAHNIGFCPGVKRAIQIAEKTLEKTPTGVYTLGPIIHNPQVVEELESRGLNILPDRIPYLEEADLNGVQVVIRSHGASSELVRFLRKKGARVIDATCPTVKKAQRAAACLVEEGYKLFIIGNADHPEVKAILGNIDGDPTVIKEPEELKQWWRRQRHKVKKVGVIAQTTIDLFTFRSLVDGLINDVPELVSEVSEIKIINTLCRNTLARQMEAYHLALSSDFVLVMGGRNSSNTRFLKKISESTGTPALHLETAKELDLGLLKGVGTLAILGGASTPEWIVEEVYKKITEQGSD